MTLCGHRIDSPRHICAFFDSREQEYDVLSPYFLEGLEQGEEVLTIVDAGRGADHRERMRAQGIPVDEATQSGRLVIFTSEDTYTHGGGRSALGRDDRLDRAAIRDRAEAVAHVLEVVAAAHHLAPRLHRGEPRGDLDGAMKVLVA